MIIDIVMPKMGESILEGTILKWLKNVGDRVEKDEPLLEISTDKVDTEIPSPEAGILVEIFYNVNDVVEVGKVIARLETEETAATEFKSEVSEEKKISQVEEKLVEIPKDQKSETEEIEKGTRFYSPLVLNIAKQEGISISELESIKGSGLNGRVTKRDLIEYINQKSLEKEKDVFVKKEQQSLPEKKEIIQPLKQGPIVDYNEEGISIFDFDNIRQKMAEHMVHSVNTSPHVNSIAECDMSAVDKIRKKMKDEFEKNEGFKLTYMPFIADAVIKALKDFPLINSVIDNTTIPFKAIMKKKINLGIAVAMDNGGLIVPVIKEADGKNLIGLARAINDLGKRAKIKKLTLDEIQGGTFTISNYGIFGNIIGTMIINQPQIAILGVGAVKKRPAVLETDDGDFVVIKPIVYLTLSFDHRLIDGALGGKFLMRIVHYLENYSL